MKIRCDTGFDITATGVRHNYHRATLPFCDAAGHMITNEQQWYRSRNRQRNWETINQLISLRVLPDVISGPRRQDPDRIWSFEFEIQDASGLANHDHELGVLLSDCHGVPMCRGLDEAPDVGDCLDPGRNIFFHIQEHK